ncbi:zinc finger protein 426-like isoform X2 [Phyllopteryx taeniolatus]|uniref:zinc finger protein 426-like isoform X2 n=1 Tax=Phyllopteryx taeniolatus TaxID=161469 RepID=UPI002AD4AB24|nr:zinc finger protein 426-like isoform X2 [Phyllopteryx taeniolatus]
MEPRGISEDLPPERQEPESSYIKEKEKLGRTHFKEEEEDFLRIKEEEQEEIIQFPSTVVPLKSEDESDEKRGLEPPSSSSSQHMATKGDEDHCGGSPADSLIAPLSDSDDTSQSPHTDDDDDDDDDEEQSEGHKTCHTDKKSWACSQCRKTFGYKSLLERHMMSHTGEKPFSCSVCGQRFSRKGTLKIHTRKHTAGCNSDAETESHRKAKKWTSLDIFMDQRPLLNCSIQLLVGEQQIVQNVLKQ